MRKNPRPKRAPRRTEHEPTLVELLDDPIIQVMMARDGVERATLEVLLAAVEDRLRRATEHRAAAD